ncbi:MAG: zinc ribbon domain-containing protein [Oscillospiraceae bacterium]|jgi:hypothetical protein|nr:zinc ribbon domain-containing protein [Oscillospiraceae bacterium]
MALIKCPECGTEVSDKAASCPKCAYPIQSAQADNFVKIKIKINAVGTVRIFDMDNGNVLWEGNNNTVARLAISKPTTIGFNWGLGKKPPSPKAKQNVFLIDPSNSKKYSYQMAQGLFVANAKYVLSEVDVIDSD